MPLDRHASRRQFLASVAATTAMSLSAKSYGRLLGANDRIGTGIIGLGRMGMNHVRAYQKLKKPDNLALYGAADCWATRAEQGAELLKTKAFTDYRQLLDKKEVDYVTIASPEHRHAQMCLDALDAGKAIYCEKPLSHTVEEAQAIAKKQCDTGLAVQVGVQGMSDDSYRTAAKAIEQGVLGTVVQAQIEYVRRYDKQGPWRQPEMVANHPTQPNDLDWAAWLGDAPKTSWDPHRYFEWRCYSAYSGGVATDLFVHRITRILRACNLTYPRRVVGMGGIWQWNDGRDLPDNFEMICEYPRGMTVYVLGTQSNRVGVDHLIRGYRATLYFTEDGWVAKDKDGKVLESHTKMGREDIRLHHTNLHNHLRNGAPLNCPVELGLYGVVAVCMANASWRASQVMGWDDAQSRYVSADQLSLSHLPESAGS